MPNYADLLAKMLNTPLMAHRRKAAVVYSVLRARAGGRGEVELPDLDAQHIDNWRPRGNMSEFYGSQPAANEGTYLRREPYRLDGGVAIISTVGSMVNRGGWVGNDGSGLVSYEGTKYQLARVKDDSRAKSVILDIETGGGEATGAFELAAAVRAVAAVKPVYAVVNGIAASAGYAQISGATRIITTESGISGSIGVLMLHMDYSEALADEGIKPTFITAGDFKVEGNGLEPLSDEAAANLQAEVDYTYDLFTDTVAIGRGSRLTKAMARDTQARTFMGKQAVTAGLADDIGTFEEVLAEAQAQARRSGGSRSTGQRNASMSVLGNDDQGAGNGNGGGQGNGQGNQQQAGAVMTHTQAQVDSLVNAARTDAANTATQAAGQRFASILSADGIAGRETAALNLAIENPTMSADAVVKFVTTHIPAAQASTPEGRKTLAERSKDGGLNAIGGGPLKDDPARPGGEQNAETTHIKEGWGKALDGVKRHHELTNRK